MKENAEKGKSVKDKGKIEGFRKEDDLLRAKGRTMKKYRHASGEKKTLIFGEWVTKNEVIGPI